MCMERRRFLKQWLPNGKLLLLSLTKCNGVPCSLPARITTKVLKNCKTFSSRPRPNVQDQDQDFMIQDKDQDFHFCPRGASRPRPWSRGLHHWITVAYQSLVNSLMTLKSSMFQSQYSLMTQVWTTAAQRTMNMLCRLAYQQVRQL